MQDVFLIYLENIISNLNSKAGNDIFAEII